MIEFTLAAIAYQSHDLSETNFVNSEIKAQKSAVTGAGTKIGHG